MDLGPHAVFIWASYGVVTVLLLGLVAWLIADGRRHQRALDALEARGVRRRSSTTTPDDRRPSVSSPTSDDR